MVEDSQICPNMNVAILRLLGFIVVSSGLKDEEQRVAQQVSEPAQVTEAPFSVALLQTKSSVINFKNEQPFCTGSIIDPEWVLTAAHCIPLPENARVITVIAGVDNVNQFAESTAQRRIGKEAYIHPRYWANYVSKFDVALLRVDKFEFNDRVNKANLWAELWVKAGPKDKVEYGTQDCKIYGWGSLEMSPSIKTDSLRKAQVLVGHGTKACPCYQMFQQRRIVCSIPRAGYLCPGDSGGPLVCANKTVVGVAHVIYDRKSCSSTFFGPNIKLSCNSKSTVSVWMYVCPMLGFIHEHVSNIPDQPASCLSPPLATKPVIFTIALCSIIGHALI